MDPWYFMDISIEENDDGLGLEEFGTSYPDGSWNIVSDEYKIIYNNKEYTRIEYDNGTKIITFGGGQDTDMRLKLLLNTVE
jgi:hypothetical protein|tara:strand:- start:43 stop:285 length:243 start_codon:yes stop_codon:yes gene_type:complete